jgi:hypothetical protein
MTAPETTSAMIDFFVSYAEADREWAEWIAWQLESAGYAVRLRAWDHDLAGSNRILASDRDLDVAERLLAVMSPAYRLSIDTQAHWSTFLRQDPTGEQGRIVPVEVVPTERIALLGNLEPLSLHGMDEDAAREALLAGVRATRLKPSRQPGYPGRQAPAFPAPTRARPGLKPDTKLLTFLTLFNVAFFFYGYLSYDGNASDSGNQWRAIIFLVLFVMNVRMARRWYLRRF